MTPWNGRWKEQQIAYQKVDPLPSNHILNHFLRTFHHKIQPTLVTTLFSCIL